MQNKMKTTFLSVDRITSLLLILLLMHAADRLAGQCGAPDLLPTIQCETAPLICLENWCYETTNEPNPGWNGFCGPNTSVHNPQFYQFIPSSEDVEIVIHVDNCQGGGNGIQSALIIACPWVPSDVISCDPGTAPGGFIYLSGSGFTIDQPAWLLIDGNSGATCGYTITETSGISAPELTGEITQVSATSSPTIPGFLGITVEATPPAAEAHGYYWILSWSGDTITSTHNSTLINVPCDIEPGIYSICARAFSGCDTTESEVCVEIEMPAQEDIIKSPSTFCPEEFPYMWFNLSIPGPGIYTQTFPQPSGCPIDTTWQIDTYPDGETSIIQDIDTLCANGEEVNSYHWFSCQTKETVSSSQCFIPGTSGCYCVEMVNTSGCRDTACIDFLISLISGFQNELIGILPVPSSGIWEVRIPDQMQMPVAWTLLDLSGLYLEQGILFESAGQIVLDKIPASGLYYIKFTGRNGKTITAKVVIQIE